MHVRISDQESGSEAVLCLSPQDGHAQVIAFNGTDAGAGQFADAVKVARAMGAKTVRVVVAPEAVSYMEASGWEVIGASMELTL